jgi:long-chain acyl-CoA synthetase
VLEAWSVGRPVNSLLKSQELTYVISNSEAKALLVNSEFLRVIESLRDQLPSLSAIIVFDNEAEATKDLKQIEVEPPAISAEDEAIIIYTSGTTGKPKGVC